MKIAILTSSRADYSIYTPLLRRMKEDSFFEVDIIAFGTHLSRKYGYTIDKIIEDGFEVKHRLETAPEKDSPKEISFSIGATIEKFSKLWEENKYDLIFALGDRYEMFAAVSASLPFNMKVAHIFGGETTLGAIDNVFRHSISLMSKIHFATTESYKKRIVEIIGSEENVFDVGALNIDNLKELSLLSIDEFKNKYQIDLKIPTILITFHPETVAFENNIEYAKELVNVLKGCTNYQLVITMPNADTMGVSIRVILQEFIDKHANAFGIESFGTIDYLSCMKHCSFMLGNTSSGFVEASFFPKYVINIGDRQKGRIVTPNIINSTFSSSAIEASIRKVESSLPLKNLEVYGNGNTAQQICDIVRKIK
ncbi:MAG TPA: UDP-N-acetylglucosamine 2-epimerase [Cytophagaceae bacterium]|nr:UDP-N-acetylglucosamine 2-epimerase [Cytophagaceae bacterium]